MPFDNRFQNPQDWKQSAQKYKEDSDMGLIEEPKCKNCGAKYKNKRHLTYQEKKQSAQKFREDLDMGLIEEEKCKNCGAKYKNRRHLRYQENNCQVLCTDCGRMVYDRKSLIRHLIVYSNSYQCHVCMKSFGHQWMLSRYTAIHEFKKLSCDICHTSCGTTGT